MFTVSFFVNLVWFDEVDFELTDSVNQHSSVYYVICLPMFKTAA